jgi:hypothetical protein
MLARFSLRIHTEVVWAETPGAASVHEQAAIDEEVLAGRVAI